MNILLSFDKVKQMVNIPIIITIVINTAVVPMTVAVGYVDHHEYSLTKLSFNYDK